MTAKPTYDFDKLYAQNQQKVKGYAQKVLKDKNKTADVVQEVFSVLYENLLAGNPIQNITAWLYGVTRNKIRESQRSFKNQKSFQDQVYSSENEEEELYLYDIICDNNYLTENSVHRAYLKERIEAVIDGLPEEQKWVFIQHEIEDKSFKEMEEETGIPIKTLLSRKHYAVLKLKKELEQVYNELIM